MDLMFGILVCIACGMSEAIQVGRNHNRMFTVIICITLIWACGTSDWICLLYPIGIIANYGFWTMILIRCNIIKEEEIC